MISSKNKEGQVAFDLVDKYNTVKNLDGDLNLAWDHLIQKYEPKTAPSYIQIKRNFVILKLGDKTNDPDKWITLLEAYKMQMNKSKIPGKTDMSEVDLIIHILAYLPEECEVTMSNLEDCLMASSPQTPLGI